MHSAPAVKGLENLTVCRGRNRGREREMGSTEDKLTRKHEGRSSWEALEGESNLPKRSNGRTEAQEAEAGTARYKQTSENRKGP